MEGGQFSVVFYPFSTLEKRMKVNAQQCYCQGSSLVLFSKEYERWNSMNKVNEIRWMKGRLCRNLGNIITIRLCRQMKSHQVKARCKCKLLYKQSDIKWKILVNSTDLKRTHINLLQSFNLMHIWCLREKKKP